MFLLATLVSAASAFDTIPFFSVCSDSGTVSGHAELTTSHGTVLSYTVAISGKCATFRYDLTNKTWAGEQGKWDSIDVAIGADPYDGGAYAADWVAPMFSGLDTLSGPVLFDGVSPTAALRPGRRVDVKVIPHVVSAGGVALAIAYGESGRSTTPNSFKVTGTLRLRRSDGGQ